MKRISLLHGSRAVLAAGLVLAAAGTGAAASLAGAQGSGEPSLDGQVRWHLVGVGSNGRSLVIHELRQDRCGFDDPVSPTVVDATADRIVLRIDEPPKSPDEEPAPTNPSMPPEPLPCPAMAKSPELTTVPLAVRVAGQRIEGDGRVRGALDWDLSGGGGPESLPSVIGLRVPDAVSVLRERGIAKSRIRFDGPRRGRVVSQAPKGKKILVKGSKITLRTSVSTAAAE